MPFFLRAHAFGKQKKSKARPSDEMNLKFYK